MERDFEGSLILEQLAELELLDDFMEAIDSDDKRSVVSLLRRAKVDDETIEMVLDKMNNPDGKH